MSKFQLFCNFVKGELEIFKNLCQNYNFCEILAILFYKPNYVKHKREVFQLSLLFGENFNKRIFGAFTLKGWSRGLFASIFLILLMNILRLLNKNWRGNGTG